MEGFCEIFFEKLKLMVAGQNNITVNIADNRGMCLEIRGISPIDFLLRPLLFNLQCFFSKKAEFEPVKAKAH